MSLALAPGLQFKLRVDLGGPSYSTFTEKRRIYAKQKTDLAQIESDDEQYQSWVKEIQDDIRGRSENFKRLKLEYDQLASRIEAQANRVVVLIDGDGYIFPYNRVNTGRTGGVAAADELCNLLTREFGIREAEQHVYIWLNKRKLADTMSANWNVEQNTMRERFDSFIRGFNGRYQNFNIIDAGGHKQAADMKLIACSASAPSVTKDQLQSENETLESYPPADDDFQIEAFVSPRPERVIIVVDGNGTIFSREYVLDEKDAEYGGLIAAGELKSVVEKFVDEKLKGLTQYWIHARIDRPKVAEALANEWNVDKEQMRRRLDRFIAGFNSSTHRVQMVDTYISNPEATYCQFQWFVCDELCMPETKYVVFAGCHNENYLTFLEYWIEKGFRDKLILLQAHEQLAPGFTDLGLPVIDDSSDLFMKTSPSGLKLYSQSMLSWTSHDDDADYHSPRRNNKSKGRRQAVEASMDYATETLAHFPCPLYYLSDFGCEGGEDCPYTHDYPLNARQLGELARDAKMEPCLTLVQALYIFGRDAIKAHSHEFGSTTSEIQDSDAAVASAESSTTDSDSSNKAPSDSSDTIHEESDDSEGRANERKL
ncbi:hypothetical protein H1R20_g12046, partial [Candolleomyces eurysporus]